jgi:DNA-binding response OmpR family regulator
MGQSLYKKCKNLTILFIEDYIPLQKKIASVLSDYFDFVQVASNGEEGLSEYEKFQQKNGKNFDIVMTDYEMPRVNGIELIRAIKEQNKEQTFIVISAHQNPEYLIEFINLGILHFVPKPISPENMLEVLDKVSDKCIAEIEDLFYINSSLTWNKKNKCLLYNSELLNLAKYDLLLLEILLENFGLLCSIDKILNHFYLHNEDIKQDNIRNMVVRLRKKIPDINIQSIYGVGYKLVATI